MKNITAYKAGWKGNTFQGGFHLKLEPAGNKPRRHDLVLCAKIPHSVVCNINFLRYITGISGKFIAFIQSAGPWDRFYYRELYPLLFKKEYTYDDDYMKTYEFLHNRGIFADIKIFDYHFDQPFENFRDAVDFWRHRLKLTLTPGKEEKLKNFLKKKLIYSKQKNLLVAPFGLRKAALIWWKI
ncbi:MAG: hypothetical protein HY753_03030 [Nitrospirae bacterium]|nr:hypothetical protein [Nitrospirota bacterium]